MLNKIVIIFLMLCSPVLAGDYVCHDNGKITSKHRSVDGSDLVGCIKITRVEYESLTRWPKIENSLLTLMTQAEKDAILQAEFDAQAQSVLDAIDKFEVTNLDLLTALIKRINVRIPSNPITKQEIIDQIKLDKGL